MTQLFQDSFTHNQYAYSGTTANTVNYVSGSWEPNSSRTLHPVTSPSEMSINGGTLNFFESATTELIYDNFSPTSSLNFSNMTTVTFSSAACNTAYTFASITISISAFDGTNTQTVGTTSAAISFIPQPITIPISNRSILSSVKSITMTFTLSGTFTSVNLAPFSSTFTCVAHGSNILTPFGYKPVQDLQRGDEIVGGKIARIIKEELHPKQIVEAVIFPPSSLEKKLPEKETIVCSEHYLVYKGKRRIGKCFTNYPGVIMKQDKAENVLPLAKDGKYYFYDIQFDHEGEYIVNGLISQSRSPYASVSPLPKELYFEEKNYKEERVGNTLCQEPPISYRYLLPNGQET